MIVRRIFPGAGDPITVDPPESDDRPAARLAARESLAALYDCPAPRWLRINLIASISGSAVGSDGTSETLTNRVDRAILGTIRRQSQVVLVGASSVRAEGYQLPRTVPLAVVTATGDLTGHRVAEDLEAGRLIVLCPASVAATVRTTLGHIPAEIIEVPDVGGRLAPAAIVAALQARGLARIVCEGGPSLAAQLLEHNLVDELCLSTSATLGGRRLALLGETTERRATLTQLLVDDTSGLYARWSLTNR